MLQQFHRPDAVIDLHIILIDHTPKRRGQTVYLALIAPAHHRPAILADPGSIKGEWHHIAHRQNKIIIRERIHWPIRPGTRAGQDHGADQRMGRSPRYQLVNNLLLLRDVHHLVLSISRNWRDVRS